MRRRIQYSLEFSSAISVRTGFGVAGIVDNTIYRDSAGVPVIPGSTVKGLWRAEASRLLRAEAFEGCSVHSQSDPICKEKEFACSLCQLFGSVAVKGIIKVGFAKPANYADIAKLQKKKNKNGVVAPDAQVRGSTAISRFRGTALPESLRFSEHTEYQEFIGELEVSGELSNSLKRVLRASGLALNSVGANKGAGAGKLRSGIVLDIADA